MDERNNISHEVAPDELALRLNEWLPVYTRDEAIQLNDYQFLTGEKILGNGASYHLLAIPGLDEDDDPDELAVALLDKKPVLLSQGALDTIGLYTVYLWVQMHTNPFKIPRLHCMLQYDGYQFASSMVRYVDEAAQKYGEPFGMLCAECWQVGGVAAKPLHWMIPLRLKDLSQMRVLFSTDPEERAGTRGGGLATDSR